VLKIEKYKEKVNQNPKLSVFYFEKLIRKHKEFQSYLKLGDVYMEECDEYLQKRMKKIYKFNFI
jgi:hypothetical protein